MTAGRVGQKYRTASTCRLLPEMPARRLAICLALVLLAGSACSPTPSAPPAPPVQPTSGPPQLRPPERFEWSGEPISFSIPPNGWRREGETSGGIKGVRFVKERSVGEAVGVGDYYILADRNRSVYLREILASFDTYDG